MTKPLMNHAYTPHYGSVSPRCQVSGNGDFPEDVAEIMKLNESCLIGQNSDLGMKISLHTSRIYLGKL